MCLIGHIKQIQGVNIMDKLLELKIEIAKIDVKISRGFDVARETDNWDAYRPERVWLDNQRLRLIWEYAQAGGNIYTKTITGYSEGVSHYDIDDALVKEFGDKVTPDSESGMFSITTTEDVLADVELFLKDKYSGLKYDVRETDPDCIGVNELGNWCQSEAFLKKHGIELEDEEKPQIYATTITVLTSHDPGEKIDAVDLVSRAAFFDGAIKIDTNKRLANKQEIEKSGDFFADTLEVNKKYALVYEVGKTISEEEGSQSLQSFDEKKEAIEYAKAHLKHNPEDEIWVDRWISSLEDGDYDIDETFETIKFENGQPVVNYKSYFGEDDQ